VKQKVINENTNNYKILRLVCGNYMRLSTMLLNPLVHVPISTCYITVGKNIFTVLFQIGLLK